jgi:adenylate kinase
MKTTSRPLIIDSHFSTDVADPQDVKHVIVLRRAPWVLKEELDVRGYGEAKVWENVEVEMLGVCLLDALERHRAEEICEVDTTDRSPEEVATLIASIIRGEAQCVSGKVDWMSHPEMAELLEARKCT